jgi:hypothetical protein
VDELEVQRILENVLSYPLKKTGIFAAVKPVADLKPLTYEDMLKVKDLILERKRYGSNLYF